MERKKSKKKSEKGGGREGGRDRETEDERKKWGGCSFPFLSSEVSVFGKDNLLHPRNIRQHLYKITPLAPVQVVGMVWNGDWPGLLPALITNASSAFPAGEQCAGGEDGHSVEVKVRGEREDTDWPAEGHSE